MFWSSKTNRILSFSHSGRLLDATKNYKYIFLLAGSEVVLAALVLGISNFLCMRKKSATPLAAPEHARLEMCSQEVEMTREEADEEEEEKGAREDAAKEEVKGEEPREEVEEFTAVDSQEEEKFLKKPQLNGDASSNPETRL